MYATRKGLFFRKKRLCTRCFWNKACVSRYNIYFDVITVSFVSRYMMRQDESSQKFKYNISIYINDELIHIYIYIYFFKHSCTAYPSSIHYHNSTRLFVCHERSKLCSLLSISERSFTNLHFTPKISIKIQIPLSMNLQKIKRCLDLYLVSILSIDPRVGGIIAWLLNN